MNTDQFFDAYDEVPNQRSAQFSDLEMKEARDEYLFDGYAAVFDEITDLGDFTEEVRHGTFRKVLARRDNIPFLHEHKPEYLLASTKSGRLRLIEEPRGLRSLANIPRTDLSERVKTLVDSGDITGMSFGFICGAGNSKRSFRDGKPHRVITNLKKLLDVTTTWDPAYASAEAQFRSLTTANIGSAVPLQQFLLGVYPTQLQDGEEEEEQARVRRLVVEDELREADNVPSGVSDAPLLAARKRRLGLITLTLEGGDLHDA
jgi:HK97 family phage prohead protease